MSVPAAAFTRTLLTGIAQHLATAGVGVWQETGIFAPGDTGIVLKAMPDKPDRVISLDTYPVASFVTGAQTLIGLQVRTRAGTDPRDVDDIADTVYDALHGAQGIDAGGVPITLIWWQSGTGLGPDTGNREERSDNYYLWTVRPTAAVPQ